MPLRKITTPWFGPGIEPLTRIRFCSGRTSTISRFCVVIRRITHLAGHLLPLENPGRPGAAANGAGSPMEVRAVRCPAAGKVPAPDHTLKTLALAGAGGINDVARLEDRIAGDLVADLVGIDIGRTHFGKLGKGTLAGLAEMAEQRLGDAMTLLGTETELQGIVAVSGRKLLLQYGAGTCLDDSHRNPATIGSEHLGHPQFFS